MDRAAGPSPNLVNPVGGNPNAPLFLGGFVSFVSAQYTYVAKTIANLGDEAIGGAMDVYGAGLAAAPDIIGAAQNLASGNMQGVTVDLGKALSTVGGAELGGIVGGILTGGNPLGAALGAAAGALAGQAFGSYAGNAVSGIFAGSNGTQYGYDLGNMTGALSGNYSNSFNSSGFGISGSFTSSGGGGGGSKTYHFSI